MLLKFFKYQGAGNDFVMLNNLNGEYDWVTESHVKMLCDRRFGVGADGLIRLNKSENSDFEVDYFNADGSRSFCGNGARCSVAFAWRLDLIADETSFLAIDGVHEAFIKDGIVHLKMNDPSPIQQIGEDFELNTGSPHFIRFYTDECPDVEKIGREIRYSDPYKSAGINVNFVSEIDADQIHVATYERGVEAETLSCGTGVTAAAIAYAYRRNLSGNRRIGIATKGGELSVEFKRNTDGGFSDVWLIGPGTFVFEGEIDL